MTDIVEELENTWVGSKSGTILHDAKIEILRLRAYEKLVVWCMKESWQGCDIDGGELQDKALEFGVIKETPGGYNPAKHGDDYLTDFLEPGDPMYELVKK